MVQVMALGCEEAAHAWSKNGVVYNVELMSHFVNIVLQVDEMK